MKKTLIALAALSVAGLASAQVTITGSVSAAFQSSLSKVSGLAMTDNTIVVSAGEDLGGGMKVAATWVIENDTARGTYFDRGDQTVSLTTPIALIAFKNTRSGGNQGAALVAPANLANDQYDSAVITREAIDVLYVGFPVNESFSLGFSYIEGKNKDALGSDLAKGASGAVNPGVTTYVGTGKYSGNGLSVTGQFASSSFADTTLAVLKAAAGGKDVQTTSFDLSAIYDARFAKVGFGYDSSRRGKTSDDKAAMLIGVSVPLGAFTIGANYGTRDEANFLQLAAQYDLSKRTNANLSWGQDKQGANKDTNTQYRVSLNHSF